MNRRLSMLLIAAALIIGLALGIGFATANDLTAPVVVTPMVDQRD
jgi:hypothetical protein